MFGIGGFNPVSLLATAALGPAGGIVAQLATQVFSSIGQDVLSRLGQQMGLPQNSIDSALTGFAAASGNGFQGIVGQQPSADQAIENFGNALGATPSEIGEVQRETQDSIDQIVSQSLDQSREAAESSGGSGSAKGKGWLRAMAEALGNKLNEAAEEMQDLADKINKKDPKTSTDFQVASQEFNNLMNAATTAIKSIGEGMANAARKQ